MLYILELIIDGSEVGLPLGFYTSQWLSNFMLQPLDHFIKEQFPEYYEEQETKQDRIMVKLTFFILSVLVAVIWIGVPFILAFIFIMSVIDDSGDKKQKEEKK